MPTVIMSSNMEKKGMIDVDVIAYQTDKQCLVIISDTKFYHIIYIPVQLV